MASVENASNVRGGRKLQIAAGIARSGRIVAAGLKPDHCHPTFDETGTKILIQPGSLSLRSEGYL
jgi:hypothetical protein